MLFLIKNIISNKFILSSLVIGLGPFFKFLGVLYIGKNQGNQNPFATLWFLDSLCGFIFSFSFFSVDIYLTKELMGRSKKFQSLTFWLLLFINIAFTLIIISSIFIILLFYNPNNYLPILIDKSIICYALISAIALNLFRMIFSSLRIMNEQLHLLYFSLFFYLTHFVCMLSLFESNFTLLESYYLSFVPTFFVIAYFVLSIFGIPLTRGTFHLRIILLKYFRFVRSNWFVEPFSAIFGLLERYIIGANFNLNIINVYSQALKIVEPISIIGKFSKFIMIDSIVNFVRDPRDEINKIQLIKLRRNLLNLFVMVLFFYPLSIAFINKFYLNLPDYSVLLWLVSIIVVGNIVFYYSTGFFAIGDFSRTTMVDFVGLIFLFLIIQIFPEKTFTVLAFAITFKVGLQFGLRVFLSSKAIGHLNSNAFNYIFICFILLVPMIILVSI